MIRKEVKDPQSALQHHDWAVRQEAIRRLELSHDPKAVPLLLQALQDESMYVRLAAARALGKIGDARAVPGLIAKLDDPVFAVRQNAIWALGEIGAGAQEALPTLAELTKSTERFDQGQMTVAELAELVIALINNAIAKAEASVTEGVSEGAGAASPSQVESAGGLSVEERRARREAALARKRAKDQAE